MKTPFLASIVTDSLANAPQCFYRAVWVPQKKKNLPAAVSPQDSLKHMVRLPVRRRPPASLSQYRLNLDPAKGPKSVTWFVVESAP